MRDRYKFRISNLSVVTLFLLSFSSLNAQRVIRIDEPYILIDTNVGIGQVGEYVVIQLQERQKLVNIAIAKLVQFQDGRAAAKIIGVHEDHKIRVGDLVVPSSKFKGFDKHKIPSPLQRDADGSVVTDSVVLVSNVFYETDVREAIQDLAVQANVSVVTDNNVQGFITMEITDMPFEDALKRVLSVGGYTYKKVEDYYVVGAADPQSSMFSLLSVTENIPVNYIPAQTAVQMLSQFYEPYIRANTVLNSISVTASPEMVEKIKGDLKNIDIPPKQVTIEAIVMEVKKGALKSVGIDWSVLGQKGNRSFIASSDLSVGLLDTLNALLQIKHIRTGLNYKGYALDLVSLLRALVQDDKATVKANPKVTTTNAQPATIYIAKEQYFSVVTGPVNYPYTRLEKVSVGIKLEITPFISQDDEITVKITPEVSDAVGYGREGLPVVDTRMVSTTVRVKDGQTITIGGLTQENTRMTQNKIPILGHIPILGYLFSHTSYEKVTSDIIIFITPNIEHEPNQK